MKRSTARVYARKDGEILQAAEELFLRNGYASTSMNAIAAHAEVAKQTLYANFPSKEELFAAVIDRRSIGALELPQHFDLDQGELEATLVELAVAFLTYIYSTKQVELFQTVVAASRQFPQLGGMIVRGPFVEVPSLIATFLRTRTERGELDIPDIAFATAMFTSLIKADIHSKLLFNQSVDTSAANLRWVAQQAVHLFLNGARDTRGSTTPGGVRGLQP